MNLPSEFINNIEGVFGKKGKRFLVNLPDLIDEASQKWGLTDVQASSTLSYNFVAFARRREEEVVLKMSVPNRELKSEMTALRLFNGEGACRLLERDVKKYWMLLERLRPGLMLATLEDDEEATHIAAEVMQKIWRPLETMESASSLANTQQQHPTQKRASGLQSFILLSDWFDGLKKLRPHFKGGTGPFNEKLLQRVESSVRDFFIENHKPVLMHGDFHHFNILSSERGWLIIDPKGVIGPACYEVGPLLINPWGDLFGKDYRSMTRRRIDILHERLGFEHERIREWGLAHAILSAWWSIEDHTDWKYALACAEMIADLDLK